MSRSRNFCHEDQAQNRGFRDKSREMLTLTTITGHKDNTKKFCAFNAAVRYMTVERIITRDNDIPHAGIELRGFGISVKNGRRSADEAIEVAVC